MATIVTSNRHSEIPNSYCTISPINSKSLNVSTEPFSSSSITSKKRFRAEEDYFSDLIRISSSTEISDQGIFKIQLLISYTNFNNKININHLLLLLLLILLSYS